MVWFLQALDLSALAESFQRNPLGAGFVVVLVAIVAWAVVSIHAQRDKPDKDGR